MSGVGDHSGVGAWSTAPRWSSYSIDVSDATIQRLWQPLPAEPRVPSGGEIRGVQWRDGLRGHPQEREIRAGRRAIHHRNQWRDGAYYRHRSDAGVNAEIWRDDYS